MSRSIRSAVAVLVAALAMGMGAFPAHAEEAETCTTSVVDRTSDQVLDTELLTAAVQETVPTGVDLFVRAFETTPNGSLDAYWQQSIKDCANWRSGAADNARPKGNIVLIAFGMDRTSAVFYGPGYDQAIGDQQATVIRNGMGDFFRGGDFTGGVLDAIQAVAVEVDPNQPEPAPQSGSSSGDGVGWIIVRWFFGLLIGLPLLSFLIYLIYRQVKARRALRDERAEAVDRARTAKKKADELIIKWSDGFDYLELELMGLIGTLPKQVWSKNYTASLASIKGAGTASSERYAHANQDASLDISKKLKTEKYAEAAIEYESVANNLQYALHDVQVLKDAIAADVAAFSFESQRGRVLAATQSLEKADARIDQYTRLFDTSSMKSDSAKLKQRIEAVSALVTARTSQLQSFEDISKIEERLEKFLGEVAQMDEVGLKLANPERTLREKVQMERGRLAGYTQVDTSKAERSLDDLEVMIGDVLLELSPSKSYGSLKTVLDSFDSIAEKTLVDVIAEDEKRREKERKARRKKEEQEEEERRARRRRSESSSAAAFGVGYGIGSSSSSYGSSSSFGGGSSGSSDGGGSSGSW